MNPTYRRKLATKITPRRRVDGCPSIYEDPEHARPNTLVVTTYSASSGTR